MGFGLNPDSTSSGIPRLEGQPHRAALRSKGVLDLQKEGLNTRATFGPDPAEAWSSASLKEGHPQPEAAGDRTHVGLTCGINNLFSPKS